jgi:hypothetical protein
MCLQSFLDVGYAVHLYAFGEIQNVPPGVTILDGEEILPGSEIFVQKDGFGKGGYASFADRFRLHLLHKKGGWWFDMDFVAIRRLPEPTDLCFASTWEFEWGQCAVNSAMWCRAGDERMGELVRRCDQLVEAADVKFGDLGPFLLQALVRDYGLEGHVAPWWEFCPFPWRMINRMTYRTDAEWAKDCLRHIKHLAWQMTKPDFQAAYVRPGTRAIHWHNEIWRQQGLDKDALYHRWSPYGRAQRRYRVGRPAGPAA